MNCERNAKNGHYFHYEIFNRGIVKFKDFEIFFGPEAGEGSSFQIVVEVDGDLDQMESKLTDMVYGIVDRGFDISGSYFTTNDPAGLSVRVGLSNIGLSNM
ncbi:hypothetical protein [Leucothrix arctica]|uniref:Uncharacterized protein n=1 Tax=Leucothrix arctica TaxID=1481894 RepID=A0A317CFT5_9GAMM|nr:hypothetical protein [Leucothrix arctica]PWQ95052.1 hypothetical protein DKT75_13610 [Leucothrix arctica]